MEVVATPTWRTTLENLTEEEFKQAGLDEKYIKFETVQSAIANYIRQTPMSMFHNIAKALFEAPHALYDNNMVQALLEMEYAISDRGDLKLTDRLLASPSVKNDIPRRIDLIIVYGILLLIKYHPVPTLRIRISSIIFSYMRLLVMNSNKKNDANNNLTAIISMDRTAVDYLKESTHKISFTDMVKDRLSGMMENRQKSVEFVSYANDETILKVSSGPVDPSSPTSPGIPSSNTESPQVPSSVSPGPAQSPSPLHDDDSSGPSSSPSPPSSPLPYINENDVIIFDDDDDVHPPRDPIPDRQHIKKNPRIREQELDRRKMEKDMRLLNALIEGRRQMEERFVMNPAWFKPDDPMALPKHEPLPPPPKEPDFPPLTPEESARAVASAHGITYEAYKAAHANDIYYREPWRLLLPRDKQQ